MDPICMECRAQELTKAIPGWNLSQVPRATEAARPDSFAGGTLSNSSIPKKTGS